MKKIYLILVIFIIFLMVFVGLSFVNIPSPSIRVSEDYQLEIK